jgi:hypothetical protein
MLTSMSNGKTITIIELRLGPQKKPGNTWCFYPSLLEAKMRVPSVWRRTSATIQRRDENQASEYRPCVRTALR